jgi:hypothetical protein
MVYTCQVESQITERRKWGSVAFPSTRGLTCALQIATGRIALKAVSKRFVIWQSFMESC